MENSFPFNFLKFNENQPTATPVVVKTVDNNTAGFPVPSDFNTLTTPIHHDSEELLAINQELHNILKDSIDQQKYETYFHQNFHLTKFSETELQFSVATNFIKKIIESNYISHLQRAIKLTLGKDYQFNILVLWEGKGDVRIETKTESPSPSLYNVKKGGSVKETSFNINDIMPTSTDLIDQYQSRVITELKSDPNNKIDTQKTFENFIVGSSNNLAYASCVAAANNPGRVYPSLYLHSASGLGKTHLLHAIANKILEKNPNFKVCLTTGHEFVDDYVRAVQNKKFPEFQRKYVDDIDVLIVDDIHELKNKNETQNTFFNIFNELHNRNKQLIFTSDKSPKDINGIEERVKTRLAWGLIVDIQQPDLETRIAILKQKAMEKDFYIPEDVVNLVATAVKSNVRELESSLIRLGMYSSVLGVDIDVEIAKSQLKLDENYNADNLTFEGIIKTVGTYYKIPVSDIRSKARNKDLTHARHIGMYLTHKIIKPTLSEIGDFYGKRDHTTVMHAISKIEQQQKIDQKLAQALLEIENSL